MTGTDKKSTESRPAPGASWRRRKKLVAFISELENHGNVSVAMEKADVPRGWLYGWRKKDAEFHAVFEEARACGLECLPDEVHRRGVMGWDEPVFYKGEQTAVVRKYSDSLLMFYTKKADPSFRDHNKLEIGGDGLRPFMFQMVLDDGAMKDEKNGT